LAGRRNKASDQKSHDDVSPFLVAMSSYPPRSTGHACLFFHSLTLPPIGRALIQDFGIALGCPHVRCCHRFLQALIVFPAGPAVFSQSTRYQMGGDMKTGMDMGVAGESERNSSSEGAGGERGRRKEERTLDVHRGRTDIFWGRVEQALQEFAASNNSKRGIYKTAARNAQARTQPQENPVQPNPRKIKSNSPPTV